MAQDGLVNALPRLPYIALCYVLPRCILWSYSLCSVLHSDYINWHCNHRLPNKATQHRTASMFNDLILYTNSINMLRMIFLVFVIGCLSKQSIFLLTTDIISDYDLIVNVYVISNSISYIYSYMLLYIYYCMDYITSYIYGYILYIFKLIPYTNDNSLSY